MTNNTNWLLNVLKEFAPISLDQLNATMSLMERIDKKYIIALTDLGSVMKELSQDYFVLSINNNSLFTYDNIYMDTEDDLFFYQHERKEKKRMKVRTRHYVESKIAFFECKQKKWSLTRKWRFMIPTQQALAMTDMSQSFFQWVCTTLDLPFAEEKLCPSMRTLYQRITLCSKKNDERITIDFDIKVQDMTKPWSPLISMPPIAIVESKSTHNKCRSHVTLSSMWYKTASWCSKYCLGMLYAKRILETKTFTNVLNRINGFDKSKKTVKKTVKKLSRIKKVVSKPTPTKTPFVEVVVSEKQQLKSA